LDVLLSSEVSGCPKWEGRRKERARGKGMKKIGMDHLYKMCSIVPNYRSFLFTTFIHNPTPLSETQQPPQSPDPTHPPRCNSNSSTFFPSSPSRLRYRGLPAVQPTWSKLSCRRNPRAALQAAGRRRLVLLHTNQRNRHAHLSDKSELVFLMIYRRLKVLCGRQQYRAESRNAHK
jgi:hypothetical protein